MSFSIQTVATQAYPDQKPGTSGLRKRVRVFQQPHYTANFIQAILNAMPSGPEDTTLVVGGDGRYYSTEAIQIIIQVAAANGVRKLIIGQNGILSTPAASNLIRKLKTQGGILLTASHNPGGPDNDFGIKFNSSNGGPAPENLTNRIYDITKKITEYKTVEIPPADLSTIRVMDVCNKLSVEIVDPVDDYVTLMKSIFDFDSIRAFIARSKSFTLLFDGMHGVTGPYGERIFVKELGLPADSIMNCVPKPDFNGGHPDPNLTYAHELVECVEKRNISFGAASDGDGDRNMIIGKGTFVNPSDSVAVIADHAHVIPYFAREGLKGLARSMPTSQALDHVAREKKVELFEVPTGWKFFGNLMDAGRLSICGEESFGTGSDHIREKDGLWAVLAWLNILAVEDAETPGVTLQDILNRHYKKYGRNYFTRYDYEEVDGQRAGEMMQRLHDQIKDGSLQGSKQGSGLVIKSVDDFSYTDPIDHSVSTGQGIRVLFEDGSRVIYRLSGTGSQGATVRLYVERYESDPSKYNLDAQVALKPVVDVALALAQLKEYTGRDRPTVIT
ncbi:hypothetical protein BDF22DRAFT_694254 [Syncephalis plumigaleata]|nr:hypothetical protein BDF22DRAFT_694254 [Syncephalis plumigaleata]